jgi:hypothetical protein
MSMLDFPFHLRFIQIHQYYIGSDPDNLNPRDTKFKFPNQTAHVFTRTGDNDRAYCTAFRVDLDIPDIAKASAVVDIDDLFAA